MIRCAGIAVDRDHVTGLDELCGVAESDHGGDLERPGEDRRVRGDAAEVGGVAEDLVPAEDDGVGRRERFRDDDRCTLQPRKELLVLDVADDPVHHVVHVVRTFVHVLVGGGEHQVLVLADLVGDDELGVLQFLGDPLFDGAHQDRVAEDHDLGFEDHGAFGAEFLFGEGEDLPEFLFGAGVGIAEAFEFCRDLVRRDGTRVYFRDEFGVEVGGAARDTGCGSDPFQDDLVGVLRGAGHVSSPRIPAQRVRRRPRPQLPRRHR